MAIQPTRQIELGRRSIGHVIAQEILKQLVKQVNEY